MAWKKASPKTVVDFAAALPADPRVERRQMFGFPCAFVNRNMFTGVHEDNIIVRLAAERRESALASGSGEIFAPMQGRVMREYLALAASERVSAKALAQWLAEAFAFTATLPPKPPARAKAPAKKRPGAAKNPSGAGKSRGGEKGKSRG
jgi:TfoX/Sxy family transcriptional regulator of competence genes